MKVINIFGSPGSGKTTFSAGLFAFAKRRGLLIEYTPEFAKDIVLSSNFEALGCQPYVVGEQIYRLHRLRGQFDYVINDSPILLGAVYNERQKEENKYGRYECISGIQSQLTSFSESVIDMFQQFDNTNYMLKLPSMGHYEDAGRAHNREESLEIQMEILRLMNYYSIPYIVIDQYDKNIEAIYENILVETEAHYET